MKEPADRIGCRPNRGVQELKDHPFFKGIDWDKLIRKEMRPPYVPNVLEATDVSLVDPDFLAESLGETPV